MKFDPKIKRLSDPGTGILLFFLGVFALITLYFGLTNGANLATIPFADLRKKLLDRIPNIADLKIERRLPNRVTITVVEREPAVRIATLTGHACGEAPHRHGGRRGAPRGGGRIARSG